MTTAEHYASVQCKSFQAFMAQYQGPRRWLLPLYAFFADVHGCKYTQDIRLYAGEDVYFLYIGNKEYATIRLPQWARDVSIAITNDEEAL